jgi:hypothetical protein
MVQETVTLEGHSIDPDVLRRVLEGLACTRRGPTRSRPR